MTNQPSSTPTAPQSVESPTAMDDSKGSRVEGAALVLAGLAIAVGSVWFTDRGIREEVRGVAGDQQGVAYETFAPNWVGVGIGAAAVALGLFLAAATRQPGRRFYALTVAAFGAIGGAAWLTTLINLGEVGVTWTDGRPVRKADGTVDLPPIAGAQTNSTADYWTEAAAHELSSAFVFEQLASELVALDAPTDLVVRSERARRDELRHAGICTTIARDLASHRSDGLANDWTPEPSRRRATHAILAVEAFLEGMVGEGFAVERLLRGALTTGAVQSERMVNLAEDEMNHVSLALDTIVWCLAEDGRTTRRALEAALASLPDTSEYPSGLSKFAAADLHASGLLTEPEAQIAWRSAVGHARADLMKVLEVVYA